MAMSKPFKHKSGIYYFRRGVPEDCRGIVGKREWKVSLDTASRTEAEKLILPHLAETNKIIDDIRAGAYRRYSDDDLEHIAMSWGIDFGLQLEAYQMLPPSTQVMPENSLRALTSDLAYLEAWCLAATGQVLSWPAPEPLALKYVAHHLYDAAERERNPYHGMPDNVEIELKAKGLLRTAGAGNGAAAAFKLGDFAPDPGREGALCFAGLARGG